MWYVPTIIVPGKTAFINEAQAIALARAKETVVYGDDKETVIHDFRHSLQYPK